MHQLRHPSPRPALLVDQAGHALSDPDQNVIGKTGFVPNAVAAASLGRYRIVSALPLGAPPALLEKPKLIRDQSDILLIDAQGNLVGSRPGLWVMRMLRATLTEDTRRL